MSDIDKAGMMNAIAEGLRTSTLERFRTEESPDGKKWKRSIRAEKSGGKTLTKTKKLGTSKPQVSVKIPAREFLGISEQDDMDIQEMLKELFEE